MIPGRNERAAFVLSGSLEAHYFFCAMLPWIQVHSTGECDVYDVCSEEFALILAADPHFGFSFWSPVAGGMIDATICSRYEKATLGYLVSCVRMAFRFLQGG